MIRMLICYEIKSKASKQIMAEGQTLHVCSDFNLSVLYGELLERHGLNYEDHYVLIKHTCVC